MSRHKAREIAFRMAFQMDVGKNDLEIAKETMVEALIDGDISKKDCPYIENLAAGIAKSQEVLDDFIVRHAKGWTIHRMNPVEKNIIRLALYEIWYGEDIPMEVALDEAVELAKLYGEDDAYSFVNGILDNVKNETQAPPLKIISTKETEKIEESSVRKLKDNLKDVVLTVVSETQEETLKEIEKQ